ncbi:MAG: hypothetical protein ACR2NZ_22420, partial [Rubripirellula sp.]
WRWIAQSAIRDGRWKYLRGGTREYLFDLQVDREETNNLAAQHPEVVVRLKRKLSDWADTLSPAGLSTKPMSTTWSNYFDHYLDGKLAERPKPSDPFGQARPGSVQGWLVRNGTLESMDRGVRVSGKEADAPFIACTKLKLPATSTAVIRMKTDVGGRGNISWREQGQKVFRPEQITHFECPQSTLPATHRVPISAKNRVIHLRLRLPKGSSEIASIAIEDDEGRQIKRWVFQ